MAADTKKIEININANNGTAQQVQQAAAGSAPVGETPSGDAATSSALGGSDTSSPSAVYATALKSVAAYAGTQLASAASSMTLNWVEYRINRQFMIEDDYMGQRDFQIAKTIVRGAAGEIKNIAQAAIVGNMLGGPIGAAVTVATKVGIDIGNALLNSHKTIDQQNLQLQRMEATLEFNRQRSGYSLTAGSIGENL